ncbi:DUF4124 domain-containing protein [uncultured Pseudoteredinibacter sp.]|uniref:DUF4124 domain-containing protein n=1 Tax=uncultured Pseudoteredinibacter sp. TaxID=1641701 RepID=UPI00342D9E3D
MVFCTITLFGFRLILSTLASAQEVYKHKDKHGNWAFTDKKPKQMEKLSTLQLDKRSKLGQTQSPQV